MGMTMTQKILAAHAGLESVQAGQLIEADLDLVLGNDITSPVAIHEMDKMKVDGVFDKDKVALVLDHFVPNKDIKSAEHCKCVREFACRHDITNYFDVGEMGIEHALLPEKGLTVAGDVIIGADSHTCTYGALGAFSTGVGSTDMAAGMVTGKAWFKVPSALKFVLTGKPSKWVSGKDVILVSSGAIGVGFKALGLENRPTSLPMKQACSAVGQGQLMMIYQKLFAEYNQVAGQVLMTKNTMVNPVSRENAKNTFDELFRLGAIPIVNENDTVSTYEMQFGDNDTLSALVASMVGADLLILLSDIDGLYTDDPHKNPEARLLKVVDAIDENIYGMAKESTGSNVGTGGMATKLAAAKIATLSGTDMIIANGGDVRILQDIFENDYVGTLFTANENANFNLANYIMETIG